VKEEDEVRVETYVEKVRVKLRVKIRVQKKKKKKYGKHAMRVYPSHLFEFWNQDRHQIVAMPVSLGLL
jgi:hypothetical protein